MFDYIYQLCCYNSNSNIEFTDIISEPYSLSDYDGIVVKVYDDDTITIVFIFSLYEYQQI